MPRTLSIFILAVSLSVYASPAFAQESLARLGIEQLPPLRVASETKETLLALGCRSEVFTAETSLVLISSEAPYPVVPADSQAAEIFFCSKEALDQMDIQGQVLDWDWVRFVKGLGGTAKNVGSGATVAGSALTKAASTVISYLFDLLAQVANVILHLAAAGVVPLLKTGSFLTNPIVTTGWPIVLGIANLGFVLGLLFIAITTILRVSGFDARRLLVRLLVAALLINFSLVLAGVILDLSRLVTAAIYTGLVGKSLDNLGIDLLRGSDLVKRAFSIESSDSILGFQLPGGVQGASLTRTNNSVLDSILAFLMISFLGAAFIALIAGLLVRYFMLIILLIVSPLAYLFVALPGTGHLARKWWDYFIRYAVYGPVVVFILGLVVRLSEPKVAGALSTEFGEIFGSIIMLIITTVFIFGAAMAGKYVGVAAASAASGFVWGRTAGRAGRGALSLARKPLATAEQIPGLGRLVTAARAPDRFVQGALKGLGARTQKRISKQVDRGFELTKPSKPKLSPEEEEKIIADEEQREARRMGLDVDKYRELQGKAAISAGYKKADGTADVAGWREAQALEKFKGTAVTPGAIGTTSTGAPAPAPTPGGPAAPTGAMLTQMVKNAVGIRDDVTTGAMTIQQALQLPALAAQSLQSSDVKEALGTTVVNQVVLNSSDVNQVMSVVRDENYVSKLDQSALNDLAVALQRNANLGSIGVLDAQDALLETLNRLRNRPTP